MNILQKLNSVKVEDIKNIDVSQLKDNVTKRPDILINIILVIVTLFVASHLHSNRGNENKRLKSEVEKAKKTLITVNQLTKTKEKFDKLIKNFPEPLTEEALIKLLSGFAVKHSIQVISFSPAEKKIYSHWETDSLNLKLSTDNYKNYLKFIKDIENDPHTIRVTSWSIKPQNASSGSSYRGRRRSSRSAAVAVDSNIIESNIKIEHITLKK